VPLFLLDSGGISGKHNIVAPAGMVLWQPGGV
jgi:hypothetical protein